MSSNAPPFDPLNATQEEKDDMLRGYRAAGPSGPGFRPDPVSMAFEHGWRMRRNDMARLVDIDQQEWATRMVVKERAKLERMKKPPRRTGRLGSP